MTEVEFLESRMREEREECARLRERERNEKAARKLRDLFESIKKEGFTEEQAFEIFMTMVKKAWEQ